MPSSQADVVVIGAGVTGLCAALLLARAGKDVVVLEANHIGALASGRNTGKVSVLQGTKLSRLLGAHPQSVARAYVEGNQEGAAWLRRFCEDHSVAYQPRSAITYAANTDQIPAVAAELRAAQLLGLPASWQASLPTPFEVHAAVTVADQFQLDPVELVLVLANEVERHGGRIGEGQRVVDVSWAKHPVVRTEDDQDFPCQQVVMATGSPILDRGLYFAKLEAHRSYLLAFTGADNPAGMMISAGSDVRSLRDVPGDPSVLLVGGGGHVVGRGIPELDHVEQLRAWAAEAYPGAVETHAWSAQDYASHDDIPYVGRLPRGMGSIWVATGYNKWGLSNGVCAALRISGSILGSAPSWARPLERRITRPRSAVNLVRRNLNVGAVAVARLISAQTQTVSEDFPQRTGDVGRSGVDPRPVGVVAEGCAVRAICTHLGGTLRWNDAERSWDCPLHGSRFDADGAVLEGPAVRPLRRLRQSGSGTSNEQPIEGDDHGSR